MAKNRETIRGMTVRILTGLALEVQADPVQRGRYVLRTSYSQLLSSKYQVRATVMLTSPGGEYFMDIKGSIPRENIWVLATTRDALGDLKRDFLTTNMSRFIYWSWPLGYHN